MYSNGDSLTSSTRPYEPTSLRASKPLLLDRGARDRPRPGCAAMGGELFSHVLLLVCRSVGKALST